MKFRIDKQKIRISLNSFSLAKLKKFLRLRILWRKTSLLMSIFIIFAVTLQREWKDSGSLENIRFSSSANRTLTNFKIHVNNNWASIAASYDWCTGSGAYSDPYIIQDLIIDATGIDSAIWIENSLDYFRIENVTIYNSGQDLGDSAIRLQNVKNGAIINNTLLNNLYSGIAVITSSFNTFSGNYLNNNSRLGIYLQSSSDNNIISRNTINENGEGGIGLLGSTSNFISENNVRNNGFHPLEGVTLLFGISVEGSNNILYLNNIADNFINIQSRSGNFFNSPEPITYNFSDKTYTNYLGNYLSDYQGSDDNGDGIGETSYSLQGVEDYYPLMEPFENYINTSADPTFYDNNDSFEPTSPQNLDFLIMIIIVITIIVIIISITGRIINKKRAYTIKSLSNLSETLSISSKNLEKENQVFKKKKNKEPTLRKDIPIDDSKSREHVISPAILPPQDLKMSIDSVNTSKIKIFLSFSLRDLDHFRISEIVRVLESYPKIDAVFYWTLETGENLIDYMQRKLKKCSVFVLFCSRNSVIQKTMEEAWTTVYRLRQERHIKIVPIYEDEEFVPILLTPILNVKYKEDDFNDFIKNLYNEITRE